MKILTTGNNKIVKGEKLGYLTKGIHLSPADKSGHEVCHWRSKGCTKSCLDTAGRGQMDMVQESRMAKTRFLFEDQLGFMDQLAGEIGNAVTLAEKKEMIPCFRPNLTSDVTWETMKDSGNMTIMERYPDTQYYDYTKGLQRMVQFLNRDKPYTFGGFPANYHLTFSRSETNQKLVEMVLELGGNVAVVFRDQLPATWKGREVINGDENDLRFRDPKNAKIVGLIEKGMAKKDETGFVQEGINS